MALDPRLTATLVCPVCKGPVVYDQELQTLNCPRCRLGFDVSNDIPNMIPEQATALTQEQAQQYNDRLTKVSE
ncbi:MAG: Trm112 family protein [Burkholderiaceae bacterium]|nr:Trm112 family protein [Burkholderiaceae bacterium]